jgi:hypothetical protein
MSASSLALAGCLSRATKEKVSQQVNNGMTAYEVKTARTVAAHAARVEGANVSAIATVSQASTTATAGTQPASCTTGRLLHITLVGDFPHKPKLSNSNVAPAQMLTVDATTGRICDSHYTKQPIVSDPMAVSLFSR